ncbi:MAG: methyltransferase domain-containing protein [Chthoniobacterales bacterium]
MNLRQKIGKAFDPDFVRYVTQRGQAILRRSITVEQVLAQVDQENLAALKTKYFRAEEKVQPPKYLNEEEWVRKNLRRARDCGLTPAPPKRRVLDLGCGVGWFLLVARALGHDAHGLDLEGHPIYREMTALLGIPRTIHEIKPYERLPAEIQGYDLVSAYMTCFNRYPDGGEWSPKEWRFFLDDLEARLNPGATICLELNPRADGTPIAGDVRSWFEERGARVIFGRILFPPERRTRPVR